MNRLEVNAKRQIIDVLRKEGYATYARLFDLFDLRLTSNPNVIAFMIPSKAVIVINKNLDIDQVSMIVRHEILHEYLTHAERADAWYKAHSMLPNATIRNIAADFEISNVGYTDKDKKIAKSIRLGDQTLKGLVTEQDHPGWENKTFEEMLEELEKESDEMKQQLKQAMKDLEVDPSELDKIQDEADEMSDEAEQQQQGSGSGKSRGGKSDKDGQQQSGSGDGEDPDEQQDGKGKDGDGKKDSKDSDGGDSDSSSNSSSSDRNKPQGNTQKGGELSSSEVEDIKRRADKISSDITVTKAELDNLDDLDDPGAGHDGRIFGDSGDQAKKAELADRVKRIKKEFNDLKKSGGGGLLSEVEQKRVREIEAQRERAEVRYTKNDLYKFRNSLNRFIKSQIASQRGSSWSKFNRRYEGTGIIAPGSTRFSNGKIPVVHVYWDVSGSFSDPKKTAGARDAIASINKFVQNGLIRAKTFYFADTVAETREQAGGGNSDAPVPHIQMTKPDNVIIITDDNPGGIKSDVTVPGGVWFLFFDSRSQDLIDHLHGKQLTQIFDIDY